MRTTRFFVRGVSVIGLVAVLSSYGLAASSTMANEPVLKRASRVMHARVKNPQGDNLGTVHDIVLTPDLNSVSYVALSTGGVLGLGANLHAIPWSALSTGLNGTYVVSMSKQQLKQSPGFRAAYWPSSPERGWEMQGSEPSYPAQTKEESRRVQERRFSRIKGTRVKDAEGRDVGSVRDMIIAMDDGRIDYTVVSTGGFLGVGTKYAAVPQSAITLEPPRHLARLDVDESVVVANSFPPTRFPDLTNSAYAQRLNVAFAPMAGTTALGYVPATPAAPSPTAPAQRPATRPTTPTPPAPGTTAPVTPPATMAEPTPDELMGTFNPSSIRTIEGTVVDEGKFKAGGAGPDMLWLRVRTDNGQITTVNVGPRNYISSQDFYVVKGDRIRLTGSEVATTAGKRVFLPTEITYENHVLRLRSANGNPLWEGQTTSPTGQPSSTTGQTSAPAPSTPDTMSTRGTTTPGTAREPNEPNEPESGLP